MNRARVADVVIAVLAGVVLALALLAVTHHHHAHPDRCQQVRTWAVERVVLEHYTIDQARALVPACS